MFADRFLLLPLIMIAAGCAHVPRYTLGRYAAPSDHALYTRVLGSLHDGGHVIEVADELAGVIEVRTRWHREEHPSLFVITLVRPGWVVIGLSGRRAHERGNGFDTHPAIADALTRFATELRAAIEAPRRGAPR